MGLCKCPKRKVTNLFCFEHRVNVCEHCLTENHSRCVVQSYLNWLKDSDYSPSCSLCNLSLLEGDAVRLMCYDIFHTDCLEKHYSLMPSNTAPAGYKCYTCDSPIFPALNQAGRVVDVLRETLAKYSWARVGLGLPLIDEPETTTKFEKSFDSNPLIEDLDDESLHGSIVPSPTPPISEQQYSTPDVTLNKPTKSSKTLSNSYQSEMPPWKGNNEETSRVPLRHHQAQTHSTPSKQRDFMVPMDGGLQSSEPDLDLGTFSRKVFAGSSTFKRITLGEDDPDANKYKRRSALSWLKRWLKSRMLRGRHDAGILPRRATIILLLALIALLTFIVFATKAGRSNNDPGFDPLNNPNVHVAQQHGKLLNRPRMEIVDPLEALQPDEVGI